MIQGKNIVITGSNRGIGLATVQVCAKHGANIWACMRKSSNEIENMFLKLEDEFNVKIHCIYFDMKDEDSIRTAVKEILNDGLPIDAIVNNAGVTGPNRLFSMTTMKEIRDVFEVNFFAPLYFTQKLLKTMMKKKSGSIINISSVAALDGEPAQVEYAASKAAIIGATKKLASEVGRYGIRVNAIAPGIINTDMVTQMKNELMEKRMKNTCLERLGTPEEIAETIVFLISDASSLITGQIIRVDGGII